MLGINLPIGRILVRAHNDKKVFPQSTLDKEVDDLVDLMKYRAKIYSFEDIAKNLYARLFDIRLDILDWLAKEKTGFSEYLTFINEEFAKNLQIARYSELASSTATVLDYFEKITASTLEQLKVKNFDEAANPSEKPSYDSLTYLQNHPALQIRYLKNWIDASLDIEVGLILSDLALSGELELSAQKVTELSEFKRRAISRFGAYSVITGFWSPDEDDNAQMVINMRILVATIELDNGISHRINSEDFLSMISN